MDPPHQIKYVDDKSILLINKMGKLKQLFVPFKVQCIEPTENIQPETWVYVEQVAQHHEFKKSCTGCLTIGYPIVSSGL